MNARAVKFILCSLCTHLALFSLLLKTGEFHHGAADGIKSASALTVRLISAYNLQPFTRSIQTTSTKLAEARKTSIEKVPVDANSETVPLSETADTAGTAAFQKYFSNGQLTRLPTPLTDIDLNVAEINGLGFSGKTELTILIDAQGNVVDVVTENSIENANTFSENVAARFKQAHFAPGEIDGVAVNSQLHITVVSDSAAAIGG